MLGWNISACAAMPTVASFAGNDGVDELPLRYSSVSNCPGLTFPEFVRHT